MGSTPLLLFLDFDGVLHTLFEVDEATGYAKAYHGPHFTHAQVLVDLLRPHLAGMEIVVSSTWGGKRTLDELRALLPSELAERVTDAVHHHLPGPTQEKTDPIDSRYAEIDWYLRHHQPRTKRWLAIDGDGSGWPDAKLQHLAWCERDLECARSQEAVRKALAEWLKPGKLCAADVWVGYHGDGLEKFIALDTTTMQTYRAATALQLVVQLRRAGIDRSRILLSSDGDRALGAAAAAEFEAALATQ